MAVSRLEEAKVLSDAGYEEGTFYLAGYSIELALKARVCQHLDIPNLFYDSPLINDLKVKTHDINTLLLLSGIRKKFEAERIKNVNLSRNWSLIIKTWKPECRYAYCGSKTKKEATNLIDAISNKKMEC
jgi:hypothetical protein